MMYRKLPSDCSILCGEQVAIKINNFIVAHWLKIFYKRGGVSNGIIAISAMLTSRSCLPALSSTRRVYRLRKLASE